MSREGILRLCPFSTSCTHCCHGPSLQQVGGSISGLSAPRGPGRQLPGGATFRRRAVADLASPSLEFSVLGPPGRLPLTSVTRGCASSEAPRPPLIPSPGVNPSAQTLFLRSHFARHSRIPWPRAPSRNLTKALTAHRGPGTQQAQPPCPPRGSPESPALAFLPDVLWLRMLHRRGSHLLPQQVCQENPVPSLTKRTPCCPLSALHPASEQPTEASFSSRIREAQAGLGSQRVGFDSGRPELSGVWDGKSWLGLGLGLRGGPDVISFPSQVEQALGG